jgi:Flp pilus assembly protein TadD
MMQRLAILVLAAGASACVHHTRVVKAAVPVQPRHQQATVWERQIRNAADAGDGDYRMRVLRQRMAAEPDNVEVRVELAKAYAARGYPDMALELCRLTAARFPASGEVELALVRALREMNRGPEAIEGLEAFLRAHPQTSADYYSWLGILRDETGAWPLGEPAHRKAIELSPSADQLHNNLGYNLMMQKKDEAAAAEFNEAIRLNSSNQVARNNLGWTLARQNETQQAIASWQSASDPASAHSNLAAVWIEKGNFPEARKELAIALGYNKSHPSALKNLELVERLEGRAASLTDFEQESRWERWKAGFKKLFVGPLGEVKAAPAKTASVQQ